MKVVVHSISSVHKLLFNVVAIHEALSALLIDQSRATAVHAWTANAPLVRHQPFLRLPCLLLYSILRGATTTPRG